MESPPRARDRREGRGGLGVSLNPRCARDGKKGKVLGALGAQEISRRPRGVSAFPSIPQVAGPKGSLGRLGGSPLTLASLGMERKGGAWGLRRSQDDPGIQACFPSTRRAVRGGELFRSYVGVSLNLAALGGKEREILGGAWGVLDLKISQDDPGGSQALPLFFPSTPKGWLEEG